MDNEPVLQSEPRQGVPDVIDTLEEFEQMCESYAQATGPLAADAERASGYRYSHEDWLVQFKREGASIALVDPVVLGKQGADWDEFNQAIGDAPWILHDARQDLPGFAQLGMKPRQLFDTEVAARILGLHRFGLAFVTAHYLGITLAKEHSAADWSYRPLPRDWRNYAALDVELLIELRQAMVEDLRRQGKLEWAHEEFAYVLGEGLQPPQGHAVPWMHVSHINDLHGNRRSLAVVKALWEKRDELARYYDIAPSLLLSDSAIIEAAQRKPHNARQFRAIRSLNERVRMNRGNEQDKMFERYAPIQRRVKPNVWKTVIQEALDMPESQWPSPPAQDVDDAHTNAPKSMKYWRDHHPDRFARLKAAKAVMAQISQDTHTPVDILLKPQILRNLYWTDDPRERDIVQFLQEQGARAWQIQLCAASLSRVTI